MFQSIYEYINRYLEDARNKLRSRADIHELLFYIFIGLGVDILSIDHDSTTDLDTYKLTVSQGSSIIHTTDVPIVAQFLMNANIQALCTNGRIKLVIFV